MLTSDIPLSAALERHTTLIPLIHRFGIRLGQGERTIHQVCTEHDIDPEFMLTLMNTFLFEDYFPEQRFKEFQMSQINDYLTKTDNYYRQVQLPNIERHLGVLVRSGGSDNNRLALIERYFGEFKSQILSSEGLQDEQQISDLVSIMIRHLSGNYDDNLAYAVIFSLGTLSRDVRQHNRIRNRILSKQ